MRQRFAVIRLVAVILALPALAQMNDKTTHVVETNQPKLQYLETIVDPDWGSYVKRISNNRGATQSPLTGTWGADVRHHYMTDNPWSRNGNYYWTENRSFEAVGGPVVLDGHTFAPVAAFCSTIYQSNGTTPTSLHDGDSWWNLQSTREAVRVALDSTGKVFWYSIRNCGLIDFPPVGEITPIHKWDLSALDPPQQWTSIALGASEGQSWDGKYAVIVRGDLKAIRVIDSTRNNGSAIGPSFDSWESGNCGVPSPSSSKCKIDWAQVSPSGQYVVVSYDGDDYVRVLRLDSNTLVLSSWNYTQYNPNPDVYSGCVQGQLAKGFIYDLGHATLTKDPADGNADIIVGQNSCGGTGSIVDHGLRRAEVMSVKLSNAAVQSWLDNSTTVGFAKHVSGLSYDLPGFVVVAFTDERAATPPAGSPYYDDEIVVISPGTSPATRSTVRYTRTHTANETSITNKCLTSNVNCSGNPGACSPPDICVDSNLIYRCEAHAVLSPDASKIAFSSCWTGHCTAGNCGTLDNPQDYITFTRYHDWDGAPTPTVIATPGMQ